MLARDALVYGLLQRLSGRLAGHNALLANVSAACLSVCIVSHTVSVVFCTNDVAETGLEGSTQAVVPEVWCSSQTCGE